MSEEFFVTLKDETKPNVLYRLKTEWYDKSCSIVILVHGPNAAAYSGKISEEEAEIQSKDHNSIKYIKTCKESLHPKRNAEEYFYEIQGESFIIQKKWRKSSKLKIATIKLEKLELLETVFKMFDGAIRQIEDLTVKMNNLEEEKVAIRKSYDFANERLKEMAEEKVHCKRFYYSKFLPLLNSKKKEIARSRGQSQPSNSDIKETVEPTEMDYESSDEYSVNTDVDEEEMKELPEDLAHEELPVPESETVLIQEVEEKSDLLVYKNAEDKAESNPEPVSPKSQSQSANADETSIIDNILNTMDPTVPFKKKY